VFIWKKDEEEFNHGWTRMNTDQHKSSNQTGRAGGRRSDFAEVSILGKLWFAAATNANRHKWGLDWPP
jgi:hypothetical protein